MSPSAPDATPGLIAIIGSTDGIGRSVAERCRSAGHPIAWLARDESKLAAAAETVGATWHRVLDPTDFDAVEAAIRDLDEAEGPIAGLLAACGSIVLQPAHLTNRSTWDDTIAANLTSAFAAVRAAGKVMTGGGSVVLMSSTAATVGLPNHEAIAAAKGGVASLARAAAASYAPRGLRVNAVAPGLVDTPLAERLTSNERSLEASKAMHPLGRIGAPADPAAAIAWLLGPDATWVTGQVIAIDGGVSGCRQPARA